MDGVRPPVSHEWLSRSTETPKVHGNPKVHERSLTHVKYPITFSFSKKNLETNTAFKHRIYKCHPLYMYPFYLT